MALILVVEDEVDLREMLQESLEHAGYRCHSAGSAVEARKLLDQEIPDLILLDWMLPVTSGIQWLRQLRQTDQYRNLPVIMLTARGEVSDRVSGLDGGADDYLVKPFSLKELLARIRTRLRHSGTAEENDRLEIGGIVLDSDMHQVLAGGVNLNLGPTEFRLLRYLMSNPGRVFSRTQLLDNVWGYQVFIEERTVDVHIRRLRKALEPVGKSEVVQTVRGVGYSFRISG